MTGAGEFGPESAESLTVLTIYNTEDGTFGCTCLESKTSPHGVRFLTTWLDAMNVENVEIKTDDESSIKNVLRSCLL